MLTSARSTCVVLLLGILSCDSVTRPEALSYAIGPPGAQSPSWAPNDSAIVFSYWPFTSLDTLAAGLYTIHPDGSNMRLLAPSFYYTARWSPDGTAVASEGTWRVITLVDAATADTTRVGPPGAAHPAWARDGSMLAFDSYYGTPRGEHAVWIMNRDGSRARNISDTSDGEWRAPDWNNRGQLVISRYYRDGSDSELAIIDTLGNAIARLTSNDVQDQDPRWSPDGRHIVWTREDETGEHIWIMNAASRLAWRVIEGREASWASDGARLVVVAGSNRRAARLTILTVDKP
jgi:TolB protein